MARSSLGPGLDGILVVAKPAGPTSHDVVALVRRLAATKRVGHGGTLDPFASGVLPVFLGHATRVVEYHLGDRKAYRATVCFGASSTTDDLEGELTPAPRARPRRQETVEAALPGLTGTISQRPPAYSAIKVGGRRAYAMARAGETVELPTARGHDPRARPRVVGRHRPGPADRRPRRRVLGRHLRALARAGPRRDGRQRGVPRRADPDGLRARSRSRTRRLARRDPAAAAAEVRPACCRILLPLDTGLDAFPVVTLTDDETAAVARGQFIRPVARPAGRADHYRLRDATGRLVAIASAAGGRLAPDKVFVAPTAAVVPVA